MEGGPRLPARGARNIKLAECPSFGKTIFDYAPTCPGAQDYRALAEVLVNEWDRLRARVAESAPAAAAPQVAVRPPVPSEATA